MVHGGLSSPESSGAIPTACARVRLPPRCHRDATVPLDDRLALVLDGVVSRAECAALRERGERAAGPDGFRYVTSARHERSGLAVPILKPREYGLAVFEDARIAEELWLRVQRAVAAGDAAGDAAERNEVV